MVQTQARGGGAVDWMISGISPYCTPGLRLDFVLLDMMLIIAEAIRVRPISYRSVRFTMDPDPLKHGVSIILVIIESHIAIHTWPETGEFRFSVNTCREPMFDPEIVERKLQQWFGDEIKIERWSHDYREKDDSRIISSPGLHNSSMAGEPSTRGCLNRGAVLPKGWLHGYGDCPY